MMLAPAGAIGVAAAGRVDHCLGRDRRHLVALAAGENQRSLGAEGAHQRVDFALEIFERPCVIDAVICARPLQLGGHLGLLSWFFRQPPGPKLAMNESSLNSWWYQAIFPSVML